jgi:UDPglucose 6-dehydrogenase
VGVEFDMLKAAERVNKQRIDRFFKKVHKSLWVIRGKRVAVLGLAFKANTDDNGSRRPWKLFAVYLRKARRCTPRTRSQDNPYDALKGVDAELVCTEWSVFRKLDWEKAGHLMGRCLVIDGRNLYNARKMQELGFD